VAAQQLLAEQAPTMKTDPAPLVAAFALLALANAGSGDPGGGICRWQAAQILDPRLRQADLSAYGEPGRLLQANPVQDNVSAHETQKGPGAKAGKVQAPKILHRRAPEAPPAARKARIQGAVSIKAILAESGRVTQPRIVQAPPLGLGAATLDALCDWSFEPAVFEGKPVKVKYDLTMNFRLGQPAAEQ
jgi:TonB family protein